MKYTRYDLRRRKQSNLAFGFILVTTLLLAFLLGSLLSNIFIKGRTEPMLNNKNSVEINTPKVQSGTTVLVAVQGGLYQNKQYAQECINTLGQFGVPFSIEEKDKTRVFLGIYNEKEAENRMQNLKSKNVESSKMVFEFNNTDLCEKEIFEILNANLQILNKLEEKDVKAIQTEELKKWIEKLKAVDKKNSKYALLEEIEKHTRELPKEITREKLAENYIALFQYLKKFASAK